MSNNTPDAESVLRHLRPLIAREIAQGRGLFYEGDLTNIDEALAALAAPTAQPEAPAVPAGPDSQREMLESALYALRWPACGYVHTTERIADIRRANNLIAEVLGAPAAPAVPDMADAYTGAREDLLIWKARALQSEAVVRKFIAEVNGPAHMGEPAAPAVPTYLVEQPDGTTVRKPFADIADDDMVAFEEPAVPVPPMLTPEQISDLVCAHSHHKGDLFALASYVIAERDRQWIASGGVRS